MEVEYTGRQTEVPEEIRGLAERKLKKLEKILGRPLRAHVILTADKHRQIAEVSIHSPHLDLTAAEETEDMGVSLGTVMDKLTRQAQRHVGKWRQRNRRVPARATALWSGVLGAAPAPPEGGPPTDGTLKVVRSRRVVVKPMTIEEAAREVRANDEEFLVFRDAGTKRVNVLYKRKDGNLGLIEPEA